MDVIRMKLEERVAALEAERDAFDSQCTTYKAQIGHLHERIATLEAELALAKRNVAYLQDRAELWDYAMEEAPDEFERIVTTCVPIVWMDRIAKFRNHALSGKE